MTKARKHQNLTNMGAYAIISLILGVIMTGAEIWSQAQANKENQEYQQQVLNQQQEYATQAAQTANQTTQEQYNILYSPAARRKQLEDANLSVGLMYGGGGSFGQGSTAAQAATPTTSIPYMNPLIQPGQMGTMMNVLKTLTEAENTTKDTEKKGKEIEEIEATIAEKEANVQLIQEKAHTEVLTQLNSKLDADLKEIEKKYQGDTLEQRIQLVTESLNVMIAQEENLWTDLDIKEIDKRWKGELYQAEKDLKNAQKELFIEQKVLPVAQKALAEAQAELAKAQKETEGKKKEQLELEVRKLKVIVSEYERDGYKATEANNWATELMVVLRDIAAILAGKEIKEPEVQESASGKGIYYKGKLYYPAEK